VSQSARTLRLRRLPTVLVASALAGGLALGLSSCGKAGLAATFHGHQVTVSQVQSAYASLRAADPAAFGTVTQQQVLQSFILEPYAEPAAAAAGKGVSDDMVKADIQQAASQQGGTITNAALARLNTQALTVLRASIAMSSLDQATQEKVVDQISKAHVQVSPRYGRFNPSTLAIEATTPNWIQPTATPSASASPTATATP
jgi:hypothetical protein